MGTTEYYRDATNKAPKSQPVRRIKVDHTGKVFGELTVLELAPARQKPSGKWVTYWKCRCLCGEEREVQGQHLTIGKTKSCGCLRLKAIAAKDPIGSALKGYIRGMKNNGVTTEFNLTREQFEKLVTADCHYCGGNPDIKVTTKVKRNSIDRVDPSKCYVDSNCVTCCWLCNRMKSAFPVDVFLEHIKKIARHQEA